MKTKDGMPLLTTIAKTEHCPICHSFETALFLSRSSIPAQQNGIFHEKEKAQKMTRGDLQLVHCQKCSFVFNQSFDLKKLNYDDTYDNTQENSSTFKKHLHSRAEHLIGQCSVTNCHIIEVGCGKGGFLKTLIENPELQNSGYGFDPTYVGEKSFFNNRLHFYQSFYDQKFSHLPVDVIICRHVIEHVPSPVDFLKSIRQTLVKNPRVRLFFETPCLEWILKNQVIWDFFYEHCNYFTKSSLRRAFEEGGFTVQSVQHVFEGQYLWLEATMAPAIEIESLLQKYLTAEKSQLQEWKNQLLAIRKKHPIALWGAGAKGVTFASLVDPNCELIDCIIDINPNKQGGFTPGSGHPIVGYLEAAKRGVGSAFVMNQNYKQENIKMLDEAAIDMQLL